MKKLAVKIEFKEVNAVDPQEVTEVAEAYARLIDMMFCMRLKMYAPPMSFDEYIDELEEIGSYTEDGDYSTAITKMYHLAGKLSSDVCTVMDAHIISDDDVAIAFLQHFHEEIERTYVEDRFYGTQEDGEECEDFSEPNELTKMLDKAYFLLRNLLNREVNTDEENKCNCNM